MKTNQGVKFGFVGGLTESILFEMFMLGLRKRMGKVTYQNLGISFEVLSKLLELYDEELARILEKIDFVRSCFCDFVCCSIKGK